MAVDGGLISQDGGGRVCTQCHMMASDQSRLTPNVFSDAVVSTTFGFDYSEERKDKRSPGDDIGLSDKYAHEN